MQTLGSDRLLVVLTLLAATKGLTMETSKAPEGGALFDSSRKALLFALNATARSRYSAPLMNKMMADGKVRRIELADGTKMTVAVPRRRRNENLIGMDGVAQAGMILLQLAKLPRPKQLVLIGSTLQSQLPCSCRSPCCRGYKMNSEWAQAIEELCDVLKNEANVTKKKGVKGFSTPPMMRRALVEKHFIPGKRIVLAELADACDVTEATVIKHRKLITEYLERADKDGWTALDASLTKAGIVGALE